MTSAVIDQEVSSTFTPSSQGNQLPARLFSKQSQALIYNYKEAAVQRMLDFDNVSQRDTPSVAGLIHPGSDGGFYKAFFGFKELVIPVFNSVKEACQACPNADVFLNFASHRSAFGSSVKAIQEPTLRTIVIIAEGMPENEARSLISMAKKNGKVIIGPATVGGIQAGAFKIGNTAGTIDNILACKLYRSGSVGFVSKSGGLSNEMYNVLSRTTDGIYEGIAIGGDAFPGSTLTDHVTRFEKLPEVKMIVILGELGGWDEYGVVDALKRGEITKPVCAWVSGTVAKIFPTEVQFGHAGAKSGGESESAEMKNKALKEAGAIVPQSFEDFSNAISQTYNKLVAAGHVKPVEEPTPPELPLDFKTAVKAGKVRKPTSIISTICDDRGEELTYAGVPISTICDEQYCVGDVIGLLWFKRRLPEYASKFIEMCLKLVADHGPCVSGAHNTIVAARAGKDLVSSLVSGLLTIGPRFGGAIDDSARCFKDAHDRKLSAEQFVEGMKQKGKRIPGIGHLIKSADDIDKRVLLLKDYAKKHFSSSSYLEYALEVEKYTLQKANNLILNVDGCIGVLFLDLLHSCGLFKKEEIEEIVNVGYLNGFFIVGRSIGLIGHALDQKRMKQPLYRHPWEDVLYDTTPADY
ncbi:ATP citrate synthase [Cavenderia fasciculata]|uniref:ATP citrate synthase n=1 Tax=Cavenderia fasciculata TaxID=261658 RepID=F4Q8G3_CACFS|nr:ATP citrate synthase [Cavenderia fasciculata]EGG16063.1 ATP citrate synthase [Cavenderia fasciculata]|eukprot:XP_004352388.1 ATP citrate synthase [Cavenderia fasciculata]